MDVLVKCSQCLQKLHEIGVVHRDVKPENFLLSRNADLSVVRVVICDFGLSTVFRNNNSNCNGGTNSYKAPEIIKNNCRIEWQKKVRIFGCVCKVL